MRVTLKDLLKIAKNTLRKMLTKRDKWVKEYPGQVHIHQYCVITGIFAHRTFSYRINSFLKPIHRY